MSNILEGREFQIWEYRVSHGSLLIRSPAFAELKNNIDIVFKAVICINGPTRLGRIFDIADISEDDCLDVFFDKDVYRKWKLVSEAGNLIIVAAFFNIGENQMPSFQNYFDFG